MGRIQEHQIPCDIATCSERAVFHLSWIQTRNCARNQHLCEEHAQSVLSNHNFDVPVGVGQPARTESAQCFDIDLVVVAETYDEQVVYLREVGGNRFFPMLIGIFEATSLDRALKGFKAPRPLTHDAMFDTICALEGEIQDVVITDFENRTFFTNLRIRRYHQTVSVDVRPSDAFVLAILSNKPIFVLDSVLSKLGL